MIEIKDVTKSYGRQKSYKMFPLKLWKGTIRITWS